MQVEVCVHFSVSTQFSEDYDSATEGAEATPAGSVSEEETAGRDVCTALSAGWQTGFTRSMEVTFE